jgi:hypothetical protein
VQLRREALLGDRMAPKQRGLALKRPARRADRGDLERGELFL